MSRISSGAAAYVPICRVINLVRAIETLKENGFWVYGADMEGVEVHTVELSGRLALVLGSGGKGIRRLVKEKCDVLVRIPTCGHVDSLNVSVSAGILLYEIRRQQWV